MRYPIFITIGPVYGTKVTFLENCYFQRTM